MNANFGGFMKEIVRKCRLNKWSRNFERRRGPKFRLLSFQEFEMPIHTRFPEHVKNMALAVLVKARSVIKGEPDRHLTAKDFDEHMLRASGEMQRRQSKAKSFAEYMSGVDELYNVHHAIEQADLTDLTSPAVKMEVQAFFNMHRNGTISPAILFIRHKKRPQLKRIELTLWDPETGDIDEEALVELWSDR